MHVLVSQAMHVLVSQAMHVLPRRQLPRTGTKQWELELGGNSRTWAKNVGAGQRSVFHGSVATKNVNNTSRFCLHCPDSSAICREHPVRFVLHCSGVYRKSLSEEFIGNYGFFHNLSEGLGGAPSASDTASEGLRGAFRDHGSPPIEKIGPSGDGALVYYLSFIARVLHKTRPKMWKRMMAVLFPRHNLYRLRTLLW
jgi:hypothetical protein